MKGARIGLLIVAVMGLLLWPALGQEKVVLHYNLGTEPPTADPALAEDTTSVNIIEQMFMGLTDLAEDDYSPIPELATSWEVNEDATEFIFHLRNDVHWVHCDPATGEVTKLDRLVTAYDVEYGVLRTLDPRSGSYYAAVLLIIEGAAEFNSADPEAENFLELRDAVGVEALDEWTIKFTLRAPAAYFLQIASMWVARPQPQWVIEEHGEQWIEPGNIVTNGPYCMKEWVHEDHMVMVKNPYWPDWDKVDGNIDEIYFTMVQEASTAFAMYLNNELDVGPVPLPEMDRVKADPVLSKELTIRPIPCTYYYGFITTKPPVDDPRVRRALSMAIDRVTLVEEVTKGGQIPANTFAPEMIFGSAAGDTSIAPWALPEEMGGWGYERAVEEARRLMAEAGYPDGEGLELLLMHNVSEGHARIAQAIQAMWLEVFPKASIRIETQEWKVYLTTLKPDTPIENQPHIYRLGWCMDYPDQNNWVHEVFNPEEGSNWVRMSFDDPYVGEAIRRFSELTIQAQMTRDPAERQALYREAERLLVDEIAAIAPIYYYTEVVLTKPWLSRRWHEINHYETWVLDMEAKMAALGG
jgi:oligopeptide transport system substrate-binding protein